MRIFILTVEEPFFLPDFFEKIIVNRRKDIIGIGIFPFYHKGPAIMVFLKQIQLHGLWNFFCNSYFFIMAKFIDFTGIQFKNKRFFSIKKLAKEFHIPLYRAKSPDNPIFLDFFKKLEPDVVICQVTHILPRELLLIPKKGCINRHSSLLPKYRGLYPIFWAMLNKEKEVGVTIHLMDEVIDHGPIICQEVVPIKKRDSCYEVYRRTFQAGARLALEALKKIEDGLLIEVSPRILDASYYSFPSRDTIQKFYRMGNRFGWVLSFSNILRDEEH